MHRTIWDLPPYHLTSMQQGMLFHCLTAPRSGIDVAQVIGTLQEPLDVPAFLAAWQRLIDRHEALRLRFCWDGDGRPRQFPLSAVTLSVDQRDWSGLQPQVQNQRLEEFLAEDRLRGFDPRVELPTRVALFFLGEAHYRFVWTWWHGILDGRANLILLQELFRFYEAFRQDKALELPLPRRYTEYTEWLAAQDISGAAPFWKDLLAGFTDPTPVGAGRVIAASGTGVREMRLPASLSSQVRAAVEAQGVTVNALLQGAWALTLGQNSGQEDVVFGTTRACRHAAFDSDGSGNGVVGALINTVPVRARLQPKIRVCKFLQAIRDQHIAVRPYEQTPLMDIQTWSGVPADRHLFESIVVYENRLLDSVLRSQGGAWESRRFEMRGQTGYPVTVYAYGESELLLGIVNERACLDDDAAARMLAHLAMLIQFLAGHPDCLLADVPLCLDQELSLLEEWNRTACPFPEDSSIQQCFEEQVARTPDAPALTCHHETWTYRQLNDRAGQIADRLRQAGAQPESLVGICMERSLELVAGILGILKTAAAYLPLDPDYPPDRLGLMLADAKPLLVLSNRRTRHRLTATDVPVLTTDCDTGTPVSPAGFVPREAGGRQLAYVIYTSGSTGAPKGVLVEHRNVMNFFTGMDASFGRRPGVWLAVASISFDVSVLELWWSLTRGYHVVLWPGVKDERGASVPDLLRTHRVTHLACVPSFLRMLLPLPGAVEALAALRVLVVGGESLPPSLVRDLGPSASRRIVEQYGPTEATVACTTWEVEPGAATTAIGRPIANTQVYVLDPHRRPVPVGTVGELYIGGAGVTRGYLNCPELTAERFIRDPFGGGRRLYQSGDLARYRPDGTLEYVGRVDNQVKIRGHRVEPGEIEMLLAAHPAVKVAVVDVQAGPDGENRLVAYIVPGPEGMPPLKQLRDSMARKLPGYMVPSAFVTLDAVPRTPNGKLDRHALPAPARDVSRPPGTQRTPTPLEAELSELWCKVLGVAHVGLEENFFDLGGDSLAAVRLMVAIQQRFDVELPLQTIFQAPTIDRLVDRLAGVSPAVAADSSGYLAPRTATEHRLLAVWERLLDTRPIGIRDSFLTLQPHPALFDRMLAEVRATFGVFTEGLPVSKLVDNPTIEALARVIDQSIKPAASLVVCLQAQGAAPPLFLIHAGGGYVFFYHALAARLGPDRPVYGIRAETRSDHWGRPYHRTRSLEELAARYIAEIRTVQPHGPYLLGGACFGGTVAFEMARQLRAQGESVGPLLLFDAFVQNNPYRSEAAVFPLEDGPVQLRQRLVTHLRQARRLGSREGLVYLSAKLWRCAPSEISALARKLLERLRIIVSRLADEAVWIASRVSGVPASLELTQRRMMGGFLDITRRLLLAYTPGPYDGSLVLFVAAEGYDPEPLWTGLARGGMTVHRMPGEHLEMLEEPAVLQTAALIDWYLEHKDITETAIPVPAVARSSNRSGLIRPGLNQSPSFPTSRLNSSYRSSA